MAMEPAAISASPAVTTTWEDATAPERPAASANGTVRPSDIPITTSRTAAVAVKCCSTCGVAGMAGLLAVDARKEGSPGRGPPPALDE